MVLNCNETVGFYDFPKIIMAVGEWAIHTSFLIFTCFYKACLLWLCFLLCKTVVYLPHRVVEMLAVLVPKKVIACQMWQSSYNEQHRQ